MLLTFHVSTPVTNIFKYTAVAFKKSAMLDFSILVTPFNFFEASLFLFTMPIYPKPQTGNEKLQLFVGN